MKKNQKISIIEDMIVGACIHFFEEMEDATADDSIYIELYTYPEIKNSKNIFDLIDKNDRVCVSMSSFYGIHDDEYNEVKNADNFDVFELSRHEMSKIRFLTIMSNNKSGCDDERTWSGFLYDIFKGIAYPIEEKYKVTGFRKKEVVSRDFPDEIKF